VSEERPVRCEGLEAHEVEDGLVVYHAATDRVHYLNPTAAVVFELCTGDHTEPEIVALIGESWRLIEPPAAEVRACLEQLRAEGLLT
jgi:hypothetical protein